MVRTESRSGRLRRRSAPVPRRRIERWRRSAVRFHDASCIHVGCGAKALRNGLRGKRPLRTTADSCITIRNPSGISICDHWRKYPRENLRNAANLRKALKRRCFAIFSPPIPVAKSISLNARINLTVVSTQVEFRSVSDCL
jgi:hypothetical protein